MDPIGQHHASSAQQIDWPNAGDDATSRKTLGNFVGACCRIGTSPRYSFNSKAVYP